MKNLNASVCSSCGNSDLLYISRYSKIAVGGMTSARTKLRISILLNLIPEFQVKYVDSMDEISDVVKGSDLIIGSSVAAREGILYGKPVIVVGDYGLGGLMTPCTLHSQFDNQFKGRINGMKDEYFSLELLEGEIKKSVNLTFQELQMMSNHMASSIHDLDL